MNACRSGSMKSVAPESAQHSASSDCDVKTQASGEPRRAAAYAPMDDVTDDAVEASSFGTMSDGGDRGRTAARRALAW